MRITREESCLLLIDVQERLFTHIYQYEILENNLLRLLKGIQVLNLPIIVTQQYTKGLGPTIDSIKEYIPDYGPIEKMCFSCIDEMRLIHHLKKVHKQYVIIAGIESHVCVMQTVIDLIAENFIPVVVANCVSSRNAYDKEIALKRMEKEGAILVTYESILLELMRYADKPEFKMLSKIIK